MERNNKRLVLKKGGDLYLEYSVWDGENHIPGTEKLDGRISPSLLHDLPFDFDYCVTMEDLCLFLRKDIDFWELIIGNCIREYVESCFSTPQEEEDDGSVIDMFYLKWGMECTKFKGELKTNFPRLDFSMKGRDSEGGEINYGFGVSPLSNIKHLPIVIEKNLVIYYENLDDLFPKKNKEEFSLDDLNHHSWFRRNCPKFSWWLFSFEHWLKHSKKNYGTMETTLFDVVHGIFWELSYYGNPSDRVAFFKKIESDIFEYDESKKEV